MICGRGLSGIVLLSDGKQYSLYAASKTNELNTKVKIGCLIYTLSAWLHASFVLESDLQSQLAALATHSHQRH